MANETLFTTKAADYAASRPSYAPEAIERIFSVMIRPGDTAADIGSGTGILSREFLRRGYEVYCVEPNDAMRAEAEKQYGGDAHFHSVAASAEQTGLPGGSVSLVTAASAFHWFDPQAFRAECRRILTPGGRVCILANARIMDDFTRRQHALCQRYCHGYTSLAHGAEKMQRKADTFFGGAFSRETVSFPLRYTKESFLVRSLSSSYAPEKGTAEYSGYVRELTALMEELFPGDSLTVANETLMLWGTLE